MTRFARAGRGGSLAASGFRDSAAWSWPTAWPIKPAKPSAPIPMPQRHKNSRRVRKASSTLNGWCDILALVYGSARFRATRKTGQKSYCGLCSQMYCRLMPVMVDEAVILLAEDNEDDVAMMRRAFKK